MKTFLEWFIDDMREQDDRTISRTEAIEMLNGCYDNLILDGRHSGDCTKEAHPCMICYFEGLLQDYYKYMKATRLADQLSRI